MGKFRPLIAALCLLGALSIPRLGVAGSRIVPDDVPTIQAALDALVQGGVPEETIFVRAGIPPERPDTYLISSRLRLIGVPGPNSELPTLDGLVVHECTALVSKFHLKGPALIYEGYCWDKIFEDCVMESSLVAIGREIATIRLRRCEIHGSIATRSPVEIDSCDIHGSVTVDACTNGGLDIRNSVVTGPGTWSAGLAACSYLTVMGCTIRGFPTGIGGGSDGDAATIHDTTIENCDKGIELQWYFYGIEIWGNVIRNCGSGITNWHDEARVDLRNNQVLGCASGDGIFLRCASGALQNNVVGRCRGNGISLEYLRENSLEVSGNTSFSNGGSGYLLDHTVSWGAAGVVVRNNIGFGNQGHGLIANDNTPPLLGCNDWFANSAGAVSGLPPSTQDLAVDPMFCDLPDDDIHLAAGSPLLAASGCGLIGASGLGCETPTGLPPLEVSTFALGPLAPNPAHGTLRVRFELPREDRIEILLLDVQGRAVATLARGVWPAGRHAADWPSDVGPGVYFLRYRFPGGESTRRVVRL